MGARAAPAPRTLLADAVEAVRDGLADGMAAATASGRPMVARQLVTSLRHTPPNPEVVELAVAREHLVAGFDLAGPEDGFPPSCTRRPSTTCGRHNVAFTDPRG